VQLLMTENPANTADEDLETLECTIVPSTSASLSSAPAGAPGEDAETQTDAGGEASQSPAQALYAAVTACADLHPDPDEDEDEPGMGLGMPGEGGWITSENLHEYMDEEGNLALPTDDGGLGPGAGVVREREEDVDEDGEELKWQRTG
jgi:chloride channel, nucleotide-sensitive, 1A